MKKHNLGSRGQVIVITGIIVALGISLISITTDFESVLDRRTVTTGIEGLTVLRSLDREMMETYESAAASGASYQNIAEDIRKFADFTGERSGAREINYLISIAVHHNESDLRAGAENLLGRTLTDVEINGEDCEADLGHGEMCLVDIETTGEEYTVEISYTDPERDLESSRTYGGPIVDGGNHTSVFYRIELGVGTTRLTRENKAWSKQIQ